MSKYRFVHKDISYTVGGGSSRAGWHGWFGPANFGGFKGWSNYLVTSDWRHALVQYKRLPVAWRQIDRRGSGFKPEGIVWGTMTRPKKGVRYARHR